MAVCPSCRHVNGEAAKFCEECGAALAASARTSELRKTVTILFCDLTGSTALGEALDPERLRTVLAGYFERMKAIVERHGGTVEKFIGDAVVAMFGVPAVREDDALRAARAAVEMRDALPELGLQGRIGVMTGEVVTGTEERLATGDAVNVAARLEQAAAPGDVLIGAPTFALVRDAVDVESVEALTLKGKAEPVAAYRLLRVRAAPERRHDAPFVGRERELAVVRESWERVAAERRCELVTIVGDGGVGKSRLAAEFIDSVDATVARGRCVPYGEGITYWPVVEVLKQLSVQPSDEAVASAIGALLRETDAPTSAEEIAWAFRKTLEQAAAERPLVVVFDDIHWAEETFLDLVEHVALLSSGAPLFLVCIGRPELLDQREGWPSPLRLEPLAEHAVAELIPEDIPDELRERISRAAGGNPLFIGEMLAMAGAADGQVTVPPTLQALLAARLDQLETAERSVLERGAVEGEIFHRGSVQALAPDEGQVTPRLAALVRKQLIRPDRAQLAGDDGFRFRHLLVRDAAYDALPKATRADLHARFAAWLEEHGAGLVELDVILGYHFEQACRYRAELGLPDSGTLSEQARQHLAAAGSRAFVRQDYGAAVTLLERAAALGPPDALDLRVEVELVDALYWSGDLAQALQHARSLRSRASAVGDRIAELCARIKEGVVRINIEPEGVSEQLALLAAEALPVLEAAGDDIALYTVYSALGQVANMRGRMDGMLDAYERAAVHAQRAGLPNRLVGWRHSARFHGTTTLSELRAWEDDQDPQALRNYWVRGRQALATAMLGRVDEARALLAEVQADAADRGATLASVTGEYSIDIEILAGDPAAAVELGRASCRVLEELGERSFLSTTAGKLAQALYAADRIEEADAWAARAAELGASDDVLTQMLWRQARAKVLARRGEAAHAEELARQAMALGAETDMIDAQGDAYRDLAEVLSLSGRFDEAMEALERGLERYEQKGNRVSAERTRQRLTDLRAAEASG